MIQIRRCEKSDLNAIIELHILAMKDSNSYKGEGPWDDDLKDVESFYHANGGEFLVGEVGHRIVAIGAFKRIGGYEAEIKRIRTHPDYQRKGFAKAIMNKLEKQAAEAGITKLSLVTTVTQTAAQALYAKCGFEEKGRETIMGYYCILYRKTIGAKPVAE